MENTIQKSLQGVPMPKPVIPTQNHQPQPQITPNRTSLNPKTKPPPVKSQSESREKGGMKI